MNIFKYLFRRKNNTVYDKYDDFVNQSCCIDCGVKTADRPRDLNGNCLDTWITEHQCEKCYLNHGTPENRNLPSASDLYLAFIGDKHEIN